MNKQLTQDEISNLNVPTILPLTRSEKLLRWAKIVRETKTPFVIFHRLEHYHPQQLFGIYHPGSAFAAALADPILQDAGLVADAPGNNLSAGAASTFFELSQQDLHEFSCDCGGVIGNKGMADRIEKLANLKTLPTAVDSASWTGRVGRALGL